MWFTDLVSTAAWGRPDGGRIVKFIGDAALVESPSAESALSLMR